MLEAFGFGFLAAASLIVGAAIGIWARLPTRVIAWVMALGAGVLIASVAYDLIGEALRDDTHTEVMLGATAGALTFFVGDVLVSRGGADRRKTSTGTGGAGAALALGALLDGIPESAALGVTMLETGTPSLVFLFAVALSNFPEGLSSASGMRMSGHSPRSILMLWLGICVAAGLAAAIGFGALGGVSVGTLAVVLSFAAGAIITMLASTMLPEAAAQGGGPGVGLAATAGFLLAVLLGG